MTPATEAKVRKIEEFINENLKKDLQRTLDAGDAIYSEISEYLELRNLLGKFAEMDVRHGDLETMVDAGCNFFVKAKM